MSGLVASSTRQSDADWLSQLTALGEARGGAVLLGPRHRAMLVDGSEDVLVVSFDSIASARQGSTSGMPHAMAQSAIHDWSHLALISEGPGWFRDPEVWTHFDRLTDEGFFDAFRTVLFCGAGPGGYAAAAFSVAAPGATVIAVAPQATLDPRVAPWDDRYLSARRLDFTSRYGYAPEMIEAAQRVVVLYDPLDDLDASHAALFRGPQVSHIRFRHGGHPLAPALQEMGLIGLALDLAAQERLTEAALYRTLRARRDHLPYLGNLLTRLHVEDRHLLTALLCRNVVGRMAAPRFQHHLDLALRHMAREGRDLPEPLSDAEAPPLASQA